MKPASMIAILALTCMSANGLDRGRPVLDREAVRALMDCGPTGAPAPDIVGGGFDGPGGDRKRVPVAPVVATSTLAALLAWVLAILRRRKRASAQAPKATAVGETSAKP
jgi:hypothetical protein